MDKLELTELIMYLEESDYCNDDHDTEFIELKCSEIDILIIALRYYIDTKLKEGQ